MQRSTIWNKNFIFICLGAFFLFANFYLLLSTMPLALQQHLQITAKVSSLVVSVYSLGLVLLRPFSGLLADRYGKRKVALISYVLFSICSVTYLGVHSILPLLVIRLVHGIMHSVSTTAHAALAIDSIPAAKKGEGIGYYGLAMSLAMVVAPALGIYIIEHYTYEALLYVGAFFSCVSTLFTFMVEKDTVSTAVKVSQKLSLGSFIEYKAVPIGVSAFLLSFCYSSIISFIALYTKDLGMSSAAMHFYVAFALSIIITRPFIGKLIDRKGSHFLVYPSLAIFGIGIVCLGYSSSLAGLLTSGIILGASYGAIFPSFQTIAVKNSPSHKTGAAIGTFYLFYDIGFGLGAFVLASIAAAFGYSMMYYIVSLIVLATAGAYYLVRQYQRKNDLVKVS